jgi:hypothetical protein
VKETKIMTVQGHQCHSSPGSFVFIYHYFLADPWHHLENNGTGVEVKVLA